MAIRDADRARVNDPPGVGEPVERLGQGAVGVAAHPDGSPAELLQGFERLGGHGPIREVPRQYHRIDAGLFYLAQHRLQRRKIAVDIGQYGHPHRGSFLPVPLVCPSCGRWAGSGREAAAPGSGTSSGYRRSAGSALGHVAAAGGDQAI
jgi:hypothetical protein